MCVCGRHLRTLQLLQPAEIAAVCTTPSETAFSALFNCTQEAARGGSVAVEVRNPRRLSALEAGLASLHSAQAQFHPFIVSGALNVHNNYIRFPAKTFTNVGMVQRVIKNRVRAPTHHTGNKVQIQGGGPFPVWQSTTPAGHDSSPSRDFAYIAPRSTFSGFKSL